MDGRIRVMGVPIDALTMEQTVDKILGHIERGEPVQHVAINPAKVLRMVEDSEVRRTINQCEVISADGIGFVLACKLLGQPLPERVAGIDLMDGLIEACAERGFRPYFLGARSEIVEATVAHYRQRFPQLQVAGYRDGYFKEAEEESIANEIAAAGTQLLFVAISSPKKEIFLGRWRHVMNVPYCMGVGGSFDVKAGKVSRAPVLMQKMGMEWAWRWFQEPRRMARRNLVDTPKFLAMVVASRVAGYQVPEQ